MTKRRSKAELIKAIQVEHRQLDRNLVNLTKKDMVKHGVVGDWSIKDVLAHLTAWEQLLLNWYEAGLRGKMPSPAPVGMSQSAIHALNQDIFEQHRKRPLASVWSQFQISYQQVLAIVQAIPEDDMLAPGRYAWTGRLTLVDYIAGNTCNHYRWAKTSIRKWIKAQNAQPLSSGRH